MNGRYKTGHKEGGQIKLEDERQDWIIKDWVDVQPGDEFFMIQSLRETSGIAMHGKITTKLFKINDGHDLDGYYVGFESDVILPPDKFRQLSVDALSAEMPDFDWHSTQSGRILPEKYTDTLHQIWKEYLAMNDSFREIMTL